MTTFWEIVGNVAAGTFCILAITMPLASYLVRSDAFNDIHAYPGLATSDLMLQVGPGFYRRLVEFVGNVNLNADAAGRSNDAA